MARRKLDAFWIAAIFWGAIILTIIVVPVAYALHLCSRYGACL